MADDEYNYVISLCEPYYREMAKEAVNSCEYRDINALSLKGIRRVIFKDDVLKALDAIGGELCD